MSLFELLLIIFVMILVIRPGDLSVLSKNIAKIYLDFQRYRDKVLGYLLLEKVEEDKSLEVNKDQINYFLDKIAYLGGSYSGDYDLEKIKIHYKKLIEQEIAKLDKK